MNNTTITRDILREAVNKHLDNDNDAAFERVLHAQRGLAYEIMQTETAVHTKEFGHITAVLSVEPSARFITHWNPNAWEALYPDPSARWWKAYPYGDIRGFTDAQPWREPLEIARAFTP